MKIVGISGSLRVDSKNTSLLKAIAKQLEKFENVDFEIVSIDLPSTKLVVSLPPTNRGAYTSET